MGQVRTPPCEHIEQELKALFSDSEVEVCQDTYTQDYIIWITLADGEVRPIRITLDEFTQDDWRGNIRQLLSQ